MRMALYFAIVLLFIPQLAWAHIAAGVIVYSKFGLFLSPIGASIAFYIKKPKISKKAYIFYVFALSVVSFLFSVAIQLLLLTALIFSRVKLLELFNVTSLQLESVVPFVSALLPPLFAFVFGVILSNGFATSKENVTK